MKIKIKDLESINKVTLKNIIETSVQAGIEFALEENNITEDCMYDLIESEEYEQLIEDLTEPEVIEEPFEFNKRIAGKTLNAEAVMNSNNEIVEYELTKYSTKPFDVTVSKEFVEV